MPSMPNIRRDKPAPQVLSDHTWKLFPIGHSASIAAMRVPFPTVWLLIWCIFLGALLDQDTFAVAKPSPHQKMVGDKIYTVRLLTEDNFESLDNWLIEMKSPGKVEVHDHILHWDTRNSMGTMWNKTLVRGPSIIEYEVQNLEGKNNINAFFYGSILKKEQEALFEATHLRTGSYDEYHSFPNYIITYISKDPSNDIGTWRIRFRKNPGFNLLSELFISKRVSSHEWQHLTYIFDKHGSIDLYINNHLIHSVEDKNEPYRIGHHALRTWKTSLKYKNFKIYQIIAPSPSDSISIPDPTSPN